MMTMTNFHLVSIFVELFQHFTHFQGYLQEFDQEAGVKKWVSYITAGSLVQWWIQTLVSKIVEVDTHRALTTYNLINSIQN